MISQLHADTGLKYSGASDTFKAAEAGKFYFFHPSQKETLKSIFIYKITSELHDLPMGYWCLESDRVGDLPSPANIAEDSSLVEIFSSFSSRIQLEFLYNDALCIADNIFFKGNSNE
ncbi:hypothetical protein KIN_26180 [Litoreibacter roseus]|uniref:Uncharacterized protein n=2 Tax=Litoreibacter roseus TaxID=2601869 RepID=A0A6N6JHF1_9RHOB|nr:hypothetical protein KIN_26180 [Litoreibacter roseus]